MARFIDSPKYPGRRAADHADMLQLFGIVGSKWPDQGCPVRNIQGIWVHVLPVDHPSLRKDGKRNSSAHRCLATCPECGAQVSVSRLPQHRCDARVNKAEALRRLQFSTTLATTRKRADLRHLALAYFDQPDDTQEQDDAHNAFCEEARACMSEDQCDEWDAWCLKATSDEIVNEALRILGMQQVERKHEQA